MINGEILIEDLVVNNVLTKDKFLKAKITDTAKAKINNGDYTSYDIEPVEIKGGRFHVSIYFFKQYITNIHLFILLDNETSSWEDWSREDEVKRISKQEKWLAENYNISGSYNAGWGSIRSIFDDKAGFSYISIKFIANSVI